MLRLLSRLALKAARVEKVPLAQELSELDGLEAGLGACAQKHNHSSDVLGSRTVRTARRLRGTCIKLQQDEIVEAALATGRGELPWVGQKRRRLQGAKQMGRVKPAIRGGEERRTAHLSHRMRCRMGIIVTVAVRHSPA